MDIHYDLSQKEVNAVQLSVRFITNRQDRPGYVKPGIGHFEQSYAGCHRRDMFWIDCQFDDINLGSLVVEPDLENPIKFMIQRNHNKVAAGYQELRDRAYNWFMDTQEYQQQIIWTQQLAKKVKKDKEVDFQDTLV